MQDGHDDAAGRHAENDHRVVDIIVRDPETEAKQLEDVEGIENLEAEESEKAFDRDDDLIVAVDTAAHALLVQGQTGRLVQAAVEDVGVKATELQVFAALRVPDIGELLARERVDPWHFCKVFRDKYD